MANELLDKALTDLDRAVEAVKTAAEYVPDAAGAVAIAWRPATPAPMTKTLAAGTVPAAVIIIGMARSNSCAASITAW